MKKIKFIAVLALGWMVSTAAIAAQKLEYTILKDGDPIGSEWVEIIEKDEQTEVRVKTKTDVHMLFLQFSYRHERTETWHGDKLVRMISKTNDDGTHHTYSYENRNGVVSLTQNNETRPAAQDAFPLSLWNRKVLEKQSLISVVDAQPFQVSTTQLGNNHYKIDGDITRELWFADDGFLQKAAFNRKGFSIEFLRK